MRLLFMAAGTTGDGTAVVRTGMSMVSKAGNVDGAAMDTDAEAVPSAGTVDDVETAVAWVDRLVWGFRRAGIRL